MISQGNGKFLAYTLSLKCYVHSKLTLIEEGVCGNRLSCLYN